MKDYELAKEKIIELEKLHCSLRDKRQADRVKAVVALSKGWSAAQVAEILLFDEKTSRHYFERYQQGGLKASGKDCRGRRRRPRNDILNETLYFFFAGLFRYFVKFFNRWGKLLQLLLCDFVLPVVAGADIGIVQ